MWTTQYDSKAAFDADERNHASSLRDEAGAEWTAAHDRQWQAAHAAAETMLNSGAVPSGPHGLRITLSGGPDQLGVSISQLAAPPQPKA